MDPKTQTRDALVGPDRYAIQLPAFEGPLDLLLFLVRKQEVDIYDIPIYTVTRQYLNILHDMQRLDIEVAGEFFVMAATLMQIKSAMLLPKDEQLKQSDQEEEEADPRWQLVKQLLEYQKVKETAHELEASIRVNQDYIPREYKTDHENSPPRPLKSSDKIEIWNAFNQVLRRLAEQISSAGEIREDTITVAECMESLLEKLKHSSSFTFSSLVTKGFTLTHLVAHFLAILELTRLNQITLSQDRNFTDICIDRIDEAEGMQSFDAYQSEFDGDEEESSS